VEILSIRPWDFVGISLGICKSVKFLWGFTGYGQITIFLGFLAFPSVELETKRLRSFCQIDRSSNVQNLENHSFLP
jgi:hypothetical protein